MNKGDLDRIRHIHKYCEDIAKTIERFGNSIEAFLSDIDFYNSLSMSIMQIGELSIGLSEQFKEETKAEIPWVQIKGMRNHFAHGYTVMEKSDVWETALNDIPTLQAFCFRLINKEFIHEE
jgi:uncharacterized protein with HEPN domain